MHRFEWNDKSIKDQETFDEFISNMMKEDNPYFKFPANYEQAARLFYEHENGECVMVELQVPTYELLKLLEVKNHGLWLDVYEVKHMEDYDASQEIYGSWDEEKITYENAEQLMLRLAKDMFE